MTMAGSLPHVSVTFFSSRRRHTRYWRDWSSDVCSSDLAHLRAVAHRMLGSTAEADDAVQEAWLRLQHTGSTGVDNLGGWLTTVVGRVCLDMLRRRSARREEPLELHRSDPGGGPEPERSEERRAGEEC